MKKILVLVSALSCMVSTTGFSKTCALEIGAGDDMKFDKSELVVESGCTEVKVTLKHTGKLGKQVMGHNWVLVAASDKDAFVVDAMKAGVAKEYLPEKDKRIIAGTKLVGGGPKDPKSETATFKTADLKKGTSYVYVCTFPGHAALMHGKLIVK